MSPFAGNDNHGKKPAIIEDDRVGRKSRQSWGLYASDGGADVAPGYTYDGLNRLQTAYERVGAESGNRWQLTFGYDRYGNRRETSGEMPLRLATLTARTQYATSNNRLSARQNGAALPGDAYDAAGHLTQITVGER